MFKEIIDNNSGFLIVRADDTSTKDGFAIRA
jgi:hypothetical protein